MKKLTIFAVTAFTAMAAITPTMDSLASGLKIISRPYNSKNCIVIGAGSLNGNYCSGNIQFPTPEISTPVIPTPELPLPEVPVQPDDSSSNQTFANRVVELVNAEREKAGLSPLALDSKVEAAALVRTREIQSSFSHTRPNGSGFSTALKESGADFNGAGENIAYGQQTPEQVMDSWMNSPGHRANILNKSFQSIGVGYIQNESGVSYWTQLFTY